jgi:hypothetical protein
VASAYGQVQRRHDHLAPPPDAPTPPFRTARRQVFPQCPDPRTDADPPPRRPGAAVGSRPRPRRGGPAGLGESGRCWLLLFTFTSEMAESIGQTWGVRITMTRKTRRWSVRGRAGRGEAGSGGRLAGSWPARVCTESGRVLVGVHRAGSSGSGWARRAAVRSRRVVKAGVGRWGGDAIGAGRRGHRPTRVGFVLAVGHSGRLCVLAPVGDRARPTGGQVRAPAEPERGVGAAGGDRPGGRKTEDDEGSGQLRPGHGADPGGGA